MRIELKGADEAAELVSGYGATNFRAAVLAMNRALKSGRTEMARQIAADTGLKVGDVRDRMPISLATYTRALAQFGSGLKRMPLFYFKAKGPEPSKGKGRGVSYNLLGGKNRIPNAFIATMSSGHKGVFVRASGGSAKKSAGAWSKNLPIQELFGPSLGHVFAKFRPAATARISQAFDAAFEHELERLSRQNNLAPNPENGGGA